MATLRTRGLSPTRRVNSQWDIPRNGRDWFYSSDIDGSTQREYESVQYQQEMKSRGREDDDDDDGGEVIEIGVEVEGGESGESGWIWKCFS